MRSTLFALLVVVTTSLAACGDGSSGSPDAREPTPDASNGTPDAMTCFTNPQTHDEIINACTNAQAVDKVPVTPLQYADGGLPPLPP